MRLSEIQVDRYGPLSRSAVDVEPGVHVLYGPNEAGKTLFLEAVLRLVEPEITKTMSSLSRRVDEEPHGYVRAIRDDEEIHLDGTESLFADTDVSPAHLANIFVVRESDLTLLSDEHSFYSSLTEHIGVLHTSALDEIESELLLRGRLTETRRELSSAENRDNAAEVRSRAESLMEDIEDYVEEAEEEGLGDLEGRLVETRARLDGLRDEVEALDLAEALKRHDTLRQRLDTYRDASESVEKLETVSRGSLQKLIRAGDARTTERERISGLQGDIEERVDQITKLERRIDEKQDELAPLAEREQDVDRLETELEELGEAERPGSETEDAEQVTLWIGAGLLAGGFLLQTASLLVGLGLDTVALVLVLLGVVGLGVYGVLRGQRRSREDDERRLARDAARAGLEAKRPREIAASIRNFRSEVQGLRERIDTLEDEADDHRTEVETLESQIDESRQKIDKHEEEIEEILGEAGVESVDEYEERLEHKEKLERRRDTAKQSLVDAFGDPGEDDWRDDVEAWRRELADLVEGIREEDAAPGEYDSAAHEEKRERLEELEDRTEELVRRLEEHRDRIDRFERRLRDEVDAEPFLGRHLELEARTVEGLRRLAQDLRVLVRRIDRDAEVSRVALRVADQLRAAEESKITDLFASDGPATETFRRISDGRYGEVRYDPDRQKLVVTDADGRELPPEQLSKGARDQLYLAARVGLAHRLLGRDRGFFVLDDPLLAADRDRLTAAFEVMLSLAEEGWQMLYLTAKDEVRDRMVDEFSLPLTTFEDRL